MAALLADIVPALWIKLLPAPETLKVTPVVPLTVFATVMFPAFWIFTRPLAAAAATLTAPVLLRNIDPLELCEERSVVAVESIGAARMPMLVVVPARPSLTVFAWRLPAPALASVIVPVASSSMLPTPSTVTFPFIVMFPPESTRSAPPEYCVSPKAATPTVTFPVARTYRSPDVVFVALNDPAGTAIVTGADPTIDPIPVAAFKLRFPVLAVSVPALHVIAPAAAAPAFAVSVNAPADVTLAPIAMPPVLFSMSMPPDGFVGLIVALIVTCPRSLGSPIVSNPLVVIICSSALVSPSVPAASAPPRLTSCVAVFGFSVTAPLFPVMLPLRVILSAVMSMGAAPELTTLCAGELVKYPVPASMETPPVPVTVELFVTPTPVRPTVPVPVEVTVPPIVRSPVAVREAEPLAVLAATAPVVVRAPVLVIDMLPPPALEIELTVSVAAVLMRVTSPLPVFVAVKENTVLACERAAPPVVVTLSDVAVKTGWVWLMVAPVAVSVTLDVLVSPTEFTVPTLRLPLLVKARAPLTLPAMTGAAFAELSVKGPAPRSSRPAAKTKPVWVTAPPAWSVRLTVVCVPAAAMSKPAESRYCMAPAASAPLALLRESRLRLTKWFPAFVRVMAAPASSLVRAFSVEPVSAALWVIDPVEVRLTVAPVPVTAAFIVSAPPLARRSICPPLVPRAWGTVRELPLER
jgi:hypothetical protein